MYATLVVFFQGPMGVTFIVFLNTYISVEEDQVIELLNRLNVHIPIGPDGMHAQLLGQPDSVTALPVNV